MCKELVLGFSLFVAAHIFVGSVYAYGNYEDCSIYADNSIKNSFRYLDCINRNQNQHRRDVHIYNQRNGGNVFERNRCKYNCDSPAGEVIEK